jgi:hypothetical protein
MLLGFLFNQEHIFDRHYSAFQFVWTAVVASVFYHLLVYTRARDAYLGLIILFGLTLLTTGSTRPAFILRDIFYIGGIGLSVFVYFNYFREQHPHTYGYPAFMLGGIYGCVFVATSELHLGIIRLFAMEDTGGTVASIASVCAYVGLLIGFAVGAGIALNEGLMNLRRSHAV